MISPQLDTQTLAAFCSRDEHHSSGLKTDGTVLWCGVRGGWQRMVAEWVDSTRVAVRIKRSEYPCEYAAIHAFLKYWETFCYIGVSDAPN